MQLHFLLLVRLKHLDVSGLLPDVGPIEKIKHVTARLP